MGLTVLRGGSDGYSILNFVSVSFNPVYMLRERKQGCKFVCLLFADVHLAHRKSTVTQLLMRYNTFRRKNANDFNPTECDASSSWRIKTLVKTVTCQTHLKQAQAL